MLGKISELFFVAGSGIPFQEKQLKLGRNM